MTDYYSSWIEVNWTSEPNPSLIAASPVPRFPLRLPFPLVQPQSQPPIGVERWQSMVRVRPVRTSPPIRPTTTTFTPAALPLGLGFDSGLVCLHLLHLDRR
ncbi:hypothetical protein GALMADRAFT_907860 [Galerina marginata CBS 339.88]|uniref:Uncharacterized protein n=1 Tax=Galerina marginata (strain CBS 339.88) TaxID=685588 RepID=A0A067SSL0_GALM3|nr:hypothetical protein GALMADRAFT_907860 [Galerina marginata CBS 339.88]